MAEDYEGLTVAQLKALLKEQGLPVSGKKADLIERLSGAFYFFLKTTSNI